MGPEVGGCIGLNALLSFEAFVGVIFAGIMGAVIFGKVARAQAVAQVTFSSPICVRYGTGVMESDPSGDEDKDGDDKDEDDNRIKFPCPIMEFRLVNDLSYERAGEIMNATVNVVATKLEGQEEASGLTIKDWENKAGALTVLGVSPTAVSYTHLTLPTIYSV